LGCAEGRKLLFDQIRITGAIIWLNTKKYG